MSKTLNENLNVIAENENIEITLLDGDISFISKLDDEPNDVGGMTSAQLKAEFDRAGNVIKDYINNSLIPEILAADAVEATRAANEAQREANEEARISEERDRIASEEIRKANEDVRVANEALRVTAEQARIEAENNRHAVSADILTRSEKAAEEAEKSAIRAEQAASQSGGGGNVHIGNEPPTDEDVDLWIDTDEEGEEFYTAAEVDALIANAGAKMELLWENASPTSEFAAQAVTVMPYEYYVIRQKNSALGNTYNFFLVKADGTAHSEYVPSSNMFAFRVTRAAEGVITFSDASSIESYKADITTSNSYAIPVGIYGIKGVS